MRHVKSQTSHFLAAICWLQLSKKKVSTAATKATELEGWKNKEKKDQCVINKHENK